MHPRSYREWLFVDKLNVNIPIPENRIPAVEQQALNVPDIFDGYLHLAGTIRTGYQDHYKLGPHGDKKRQVDIFIAPRRVTSSYLKIDYSPVNVRETGRILLGRYLHHLLGDTWLEDFRQGHLTRIDLAFDARRVAIENLLIEDYAPRDKSMLYRGEAGEVETYYFPNKGNKQLVVYDKPQEQIDTGQVLPSPNHRRAAVTRFEYRIRGLRGYTLENFIERYSRYENPFNDYFVKKFATVTMDRMTPESQRLFFDACRFRGRENVLAGMKDESIREACQAYYEALQPPEFFLRRMWLWSGLRHALDGALPTLRAGGAAS